MHSQTKIPIAPLHTLYRYDHETFIVLPGGMHVLLSHGNKLSVIEISTGNIITTKNFPSQKKCMHAIRNIRAVSPADFKYLLFETADRKLISVYLTADTSGSIVAQHDEWLRAAVFSPDGNFLVTIIEENRYRKKECTPRIWDVRTGTCLRTLVGHTDEIKDCAISPNGEYIVTASDDKTLKIWQLQTGICLNTLRGHLDPVTVCAVTPNNEYIVSGGGVSTGRSKLQPDGTYAGYCGEPEQFALKIWRLSTGECVNTLIGHTRVINDIAISPCGGFIVSASWDFTLKIWNLRTGECIASLGAIWKDHDEVYDYPDHCAISADGSRLVSLTYSGILKIWDLHSILWPHRFANLQNFPGAISTLAALRQPHPLTRPRSFSAAASLTWYPEPLHKDCIACTERPVSIAFLPCGHMSYCANCAPSHTGSNCPQCKSPIGSRLQPTGAPPVWSTPTLPARSSSPPPFSPMMMQSKISSSQQDCIMCGIRLANTVFSPCAHMVLCNLCNPRYMQKNCPVCHQGIARKQKIFPSGL